MKILFITDLYPVNADETTTPVTLHNFVIEWIKAGHEVEVIKPNFILNSFLRSKPFYKTGFYEYEGVSIFNVNYHTPFLFDVIKKLFTSLRGGGKWFDLFQKISMSLRGRSEATDAAIQKGFNFEDYDIIISHMPSGNIFANKLAQKYNKSLVCGVHYSDIEVLTNPIYAIYFKTQLKMAFKHAKKIACRSFVLQKKLNKLLPENAEKTFVAASGVSSDFVLQNSQPFTIITCANLIKRKNIDKLIMALNELEDFELKIIGDGKELKNLKRRVGLLSHQNKIQFLGRLPHKKVLEEMQKSDIFILPSVSETFGMVYLEAMASGCITVCTKNDGIDGIIKDGENGFLCEPTVEGIKETLLRIKNIGAHGAPYNLEQIRANSLETVKKYSPEACAQNYLNNIL